MEDRVPHEIRVDGRELFVYADLIGPLRDYLPPLRNGISGATGDWASWEVVDGTLWLRDLAAGGAGSPAAGSAPAAFPFGQPPVAATWFTGVLRIVGGRRVWHHPPGVAPGPGTTWSIHAEEEFHLTVHDGRVTGREESVPSGALGSAGGFQLQATVPWHDPRKGLNYVFVGTAPGGGEVIVKTPHLQQLARGFDTRFPRGPTWLPLPTVLFGRAAGGWQPREPSLYRDALKGAVLREARILESDGGLLLPELRAVEWHNSVSTLPALVVERLYGAGAPIDADVVHRLLVALADAVARGTFDAHGDLKPEHVFVTVDGRVRVCDPAPRFDDTWTRGFTPRYNPFGWTGVAADVAACASMIRFFEDGRGYGWAEQVLGPVTDRSAYPDHVLRDRTPPAWAASHAEAAELLRRELSGKRPVEPVRGQASPSSARRPGSGFPVPGEQFGRYSIGRELGRGGMGVVYEAVDGRLDRPVAIKIMLPRLAGDQAFVRRFEREASILAQIRSRCIVPLHDYGEHGDIVYLVTDLYPDGDLAQWLDRHGALDAWHALALVTDVTEALDDAHRAGVIHRDIKPSNVFLWDRKDRLLGYLGDFGLAGQTGSDLTATGTLMGSLATMAPELHDGSKGDRRSDLYAVGCVLWASLTGRLPYRGNPQELIYAHLTQPLPQLEEGSDFERAVNGLLRGTMAKDPAQRFPDAGTLLARLRAAAALAPHTVIAADTVVDAAPTPVPPTLPPSAIGGQAPPDQGPATEAAPGDGRPPPRPPLESEPREEEPQVVRTGLLSRRGVILLLVVLSLVLTAVAAGWWIYSTGRAGFGPLSAEEEQAVAAIVEGVGEEIDWADPAPLDCAATALASDVRLDGLQNGGIVDSNLDYQGDWDRFAIEFYAHLLSCDDRWPSLLTDEWDYGDHAVGCFAAQGVDDMARVLAVELDDDARSDTSIERDLAECIHPPVEQARLSDAGIRAPFTHRMIVSGPQGPVGTPDRYVVEVGASEFEGSGPSIDVVVPATTRYRATVTPVYFYDADGRPVTGDPFTVAGRP